MSTKDLQLILDESNIIYHSTSQSMGIRLYKSTEKNNTKINKIREFTPLRFKSPINTTILITYNYEDKKEKSGDEEEKQNSSPTNNSTYNKMFYAEYNNESDHQSDDKSQTNDIPNSPQTNPNESPSKNFPMKNKFNSSQFNFRITKSCSTSNTKQKFNKDIVSINQSFTKNFIENKNKNEMTKNCSNSNLKKCKKKLSEFNKSSFAQTNNIKNNIITPKDKIISNKVINKFHNKEDTTSIVHQYSHVIKYLPKKSKNKLKPEDLEQKQNGEKKYRKASNGIDDIKKKIKKIIQSPSSVKIKFHNNHNEHKSKNKPERKKLKEKTDSVIKILSPENKGEKKGLSNEILRKKTEKYHLLVQRLSSKTKTVFKIKNAISDESVININSISNINNTNDKSPIKIRNTDVSENSPEENTKKIKKKNKNENFGRKRGRSEHIHILTTKKSPNDPKILILNTKPKKELNSPYKSKPKLNFLLHYNKKGEKANNDNSINTNKNKSKRKTVGSLIIKNGCDELKNSGHHHGSVKVIDKFPSDGDDSPLSSAFSRRTLELRNKISLKNIDIDKFLNKENREKMQFNLFKKDKESLVFTNTEFVKNDYYKHILDCLEYIIDLESTRNNERKELAKVKFNFSKEELKKKKIALFDLDETLIHCTGKIDDSKKNYQHKVKIQLPNKQFVYVGINLRPLWNVTLDLIKDKYNIVVFTASHQNYADSVLDFMDPEKKYFKHRLYRNNCALVNLDGGKFYIKDLDILDKYYNLKDIVIIDNSVLSFAYHLDNGIPILPYYDKDEDKSLFVVGLYLYNISNYNDLREANKIYININYLLDMVKNNNLEDIHDSSEESSKDSWSNGNNVEKNKINETKKNKPEKSDEHVIEKKSTIKTVKYSNHEIKNEFDDDHKKRKSEEKMASFVCNQSKLLYAYTELDKQQPEENKENFINLNSSKRKSEENNNNKIENGSVNKNENIDKENDSISSSKIDDSSSRDQIFVIKPNSEDNSERKLNRINENIQKTIKTNENLNPQFFFFQNGNLAKNLSIDLENNFSELKLECIKSKFYKIFPKKPDEN